MLGATAFVSSEFGSTGLLQMLGNTDITEYGHGQKERRRLVLSSSDAGEHGPKDMVRLMGNLRFHFDVPSAEVYRNCEANSLPIFFH